MAVGLFSALGIVIYGGIGYILYLLIERAKKISKIVIPQWLEVTASVLWPLTVLGTILMKVFQKD